MLRHRANAALSRMRPFVALPLSAFALAACTALPSRIAIAMGPAAGSSRTFHLLGGLVADVAIVGPLFLVAVGLASWAPRVRATVALLVVFAVVLLAQNAATEFRFERGVLPGPIDVREGFGHHDFLTAEAPRLFAGRFAWANLACVAAAIAIVLRRRERPPARGIVLGVAVSIALVIGARRAEAYAVSLHNRAALASPSAAIVRGLVNGASYRGSPDEIRRLLVDHPGTANEAAEGARQLGYSPASATRLVRALPPTPSESCVDHPLRRPLEPALEAQEADRATPEIVVAARELSRALFAGRDEAPVVFHVSLESMRADDLHAIDPSAPASLAPKLNAIYDGDAGAIAFRHAHQSGVRTSQSLGAVLCGLGAMPFNISMARDLGVLPLRCLPDVLVDAGFRARAFYGHDFVFDDMGSFFGAHHVELVERDAFAKDVPHGVWDGVSDASVYSAAIAASERDGSRRARYEFVLTLSHHAPYTEPVDAAPADREAMSELCRARSLRGENCARLHTMRYADRALGRFLESVEASSNAARTIVVAAGDHTVHRAAPWGDRDTERGITQIPLFVWLPRAAQERAGDRAELARALDRLRSIAASTPISSADLPSLILAVLAESRPLATLPAPARWHTLGGVTTSPWYRSLTGHGVLHGVDAHGDVFDVAHDGTVHAGGFSMETLRAPEDVANASAWDRPAIAFTGHFLRGWAATCRR